MSDCYNDNCYISPPPSSDRMLFHWYPDGVEAAMPWPITCRISDCLIESNIVHTFANGDIFIQCVNGKATYRPFGYDYFGVIANLVMATYEPTA